MAIQYLSIDDVKRIRSQLSRDLMAQEDYFGGAEALYPDKLASAVGRQTSGLGEHLKYTEIHEVAATLFYGIAQNHAFENGNKRTALVVMLVFLSQNKVILTNTDEDELYDLVTKLVNHELVGADGAGVSDREVRHVADWIESRSRTLSIGDRMMEFGELRTQLEDLGCEFDKPNGNYIKVRRGGRSFRMGYPRAKFNVDAHIVKDLRRALALDEVHGVDSAAFYDLEGSATEFVNRYRNLMRRLAD